MNGKQRGLSSLRTFSRKKALYYGDPPGHMTPRATSAASAG